MSVAVSGSPLEQEASARRWRHRARATLLVSFGVLLALGVALLWLTWQGEPVAGPIWNLLGLAALASAVLFVAAMAMLKRGLALEPPRPWERRPSHPTRSPLDEEP